jgi:hypothetical protein
MTDAEKIEKLTVAVKELLAVLKSTIEQVNKQGAKLDLLTDYVKCL